MSHRFTKHYTREEATALLPKIRQWLEDLSGAALIWAGTVSAVGSGP
jgi:hypothetical protein